ncbi:cuticle protein 16.5-like [Aricia agestis]|uniref:cuticle protein 16.5-like n=1 Tax=Aricia agestis TaxID=91739 RepID=UPI001C201AF7|nr:cuticle protein 16.5-like [Aricia agestis]
MQSLVVFLAVAAVARASLLPLAEPYGYGYAALSPYAYSVPAVVAPSAVSHQSRVDISSSPAVISESYSTPYLAASPFWGHAHLLKKRSLGYLAVAAPVVTHAVAAPVVTQAVGASAVTHQSRVDVQSSPAVISESFVAGPAVTYSSPYYTPYAYGLHGHILKKRSLGYLGPVAYSTPVVAHSIAPSAVSHQSRVDIKSSPAIVSEQIVAAPVVARTFAAPVVAHAVATPVVAHAIAPSAVSHQSRVDYKSSPAVVTESVVAAPVVHSAAYAPINAYSLYGW